MLAETKPGKHGLAAGEAGRPVSDDWTVDQGWERYTAAEHATWKTLFERQTRLLPDRACDEFVQGMKDLPIGPEQIPDFRRLSEVLMRRTGWQVVAVPGLVEAGFDPNMLDGHEKITALHGAAWCGRADNVAFLLAYPQDLEHRNVYGANALGTAIHGSTNCHEPHAGDYERTVELLIEAGSSINPDLGDLLMGSEAVTAIVEAALAGD